MPIYEWKCYQCGTRRTIQAKFQAEIWKKQQTCNCGNIMRRDYSGFGGFTLKGSWPGKNIKKSEEEAK